MRRLLPLLLCLLCGCCDFWIDDDPPPVQAWPVRTPATADQLYKLGRLAFQELDYRRAEHLLVQAVQLGAGEEARKLLDRTQWILGETKAEYTDALKQLVGRRRGCGNQVEYELKRLLDEGEESLRGGDRAAADEAGRRAVEALRAFPYVIRRDGFEKRARALLEGAWPSLNDVEALKGIAQRQFDGFEYRQAHRTLEWLRFLAPDDPWVKKMHTIVELLASDRLSWKVTVGDSSSDPGKP